MKQSALPLLAAILVTACAHPVLRSTGGGLSVDAPVRPEASAVSRIAAPEHAAVDVTFKTERRTVQDLPNAFYEIRAMYTSAVVRSPALLSDFHTGVMARPNSLTGYSLNAPAPGTPVPAGAPRLRYAQHPAEDDPYFPSLVDGTKMLNPTQDPAVYFLGQGILQTAHTAGFPPPLLDPFADGVSSKPIGSFNDAQSAKLAAAATEAALNSIFNGVTYDDPAGNHAAAPVVQDRPLTDNRTITLSRYYKWRLPFAATALHLGNSLPLGRIVFDIRLLDSAGRIVASGGTARMLQAGANPLAVSMKYDSQGLVSKLYVDLAALTGLPAAPAAPPLTPAFTALAGDLLASYGTDTGPIAVELAQNGDVWIANRTAGTVQHLAALGALVATYPGFVAPSDVAIDPHGDVWIAEAGADQVQRISQAGVLRDVVAVGSGPETLAIDPIGNVWVGNAGDGTVTKLANNGLILGTFAVGGMPVYLEISSLGTVWVADPAGDLLVELSALGAVLGTHPVVSDPTGLAFDLFGRLWSALDGSGKLGVFGAGTLLADYPLAAARKVAIDAGQTAWGTSETGSLVGIRAWDGTEYGTAATLAGPEDVAIDSYRGTVWISEYDGGAGNTIRKLATGLLLAVGSTLAGTTTLGFADGSGASARFSSPEGVAIDAAGNTYVADTQNHRIRKITSSGTVTTLAGSGIQGWTDGPGFQARFTEPAGIAVAAAGTVYVADRLTHTVRKITQAGLVTTLSGSGQTGFTNGIGQVAQFDEPTGIAVTPGGTVYVSEPANHRIRKILPDGLTSTVAPGDVLGFNSPRGMAVDAYGNLLVANTGLHDIRKVTPGGVVSILTGNGTPGYVNGPIAAARFNTPVGLCFDTAGNLYVYDQGNHVIRRISPTGIVTTVGGDGAAGALDGHPLQMRFLVPQGLAINSSGTLVVADTGNHEIRRLTPPGPLPAYLAAAAPTVTTLAGNGTLASINGTGTGASFYEPYGVALTPAGNLIVTEIGNHRIRTVTAGGTAGTLTGTAGVGYVDDSLLLAKFYRPAYPSVDALGNVFVGDQNHRIRYIDIPGATVSTAAGSGPTLGGYVDGPATDSARFSAPLGVAIDTSGNVFVADFSNNVIRKLDTSNSVSTYAGTAFSAGSVDGPPGVGKLNGPHGLAIDAAGNLYTADFWGHIIRKILPGGTIVTIAGAPSAGYVDGPASSARFNMPTGVAVDAAGNVYVSDSYNHRIRKIDTAGLVTTYAGSGPTAGAGAFADGSGPSARFNVPVGLAMSPSGILYVADEANNRIRKITP